LDVDPNYGRGLIVWSALIFGVPIGFVFAILRARGGYSDLLFFVLFFTILLIVHLVIAQGFTKSSLRLLLITLLYTVPIDGVLRLGFPQAAFWAYFIAPAFLLLLQTFSAVRSLLLSHQFRRTRLNSMAWSGQDLELARVQGLTDLSLDVTHRPQYDLIVLLAFVIVGPYGYFRSVPLHTLLACHLGLSATFMALAIAAVLVKNGRKMSQPGFSGLPVPASTTVEPSYVDVSRLINQQQEPLYRPTEVTEEAIIDYYDRCGEVRKLYFYDSAMLLVIEGAYVVLALLPIRRFSPSVVGISGGALMAMALAFIQIPFFIGQKRLAMDLTSPFSGTPYRKLLKQLEKESPSWTLLQVTEVVGAGTFGPAIMLIGKYVLERLVK
jgi:hypothetical protein